jgi:hypothetical protein
MLEAALTDGLKDSYESGENGTAEVDRSHGGLSGAGLTDFRIGVRGSGLTGPDSIAGADEE